MAKEIREIIAFEEQQAAGDPVKLAGLDDLRSAVYNAEKKGALSPSLPQFSNEVQLSVNPPATLRTAEYLNSSQLVEQEHEALKAFFGKEVSVIFPPALLLETQKVAEAEGFGALQSLYFPEVVFEQQGGYPGWKVKPEEWYWEKIKEGKVSPDAVKLGGYWSLFDTSVRPNYDNGKQLFANDMLAGIAQRGRREGKIAVSEDLRHVPEVSRFGISPDERDQFILPELTRLLRLTGKTSEATIRIPTEMEFNFAGNMHYSHLGQVNTGEWLHDKFKNNEYNEWLIGGNSGGGGLANVTYYYWNDDHCDGIAFRPLVVFSSKT